MGGPIGEEVTQPARDKAAIPPSTAVAHRLEGRLGALAFPLSETASRDPTETSPGPLLRGGELRFLKASGPLKDWSDERVCSVVFICFPILLALVNSLISGQKFV